MTSTVKPIPDGYHIATHKEDVSAEELQERAPASHGG